MLILLVTGMPGAGKEEFLTVARKMNIPFLRMGDIVRNLYSDNDVEKNEGISLGQFADRERKLYGRNIWANRALEEMSGDLFLIDGCRSMDEVVSYRELTSNVKIVAIHSSPNTRYERLVKRDRDDAPKDLKDFESRDKREISWGLGEVIAQSDIMIVNSTTLDNFYLASEIILKEL